MIANTSNLWQMHTQVWVKRELIKLKKCKVIFSNWITVIANHNQCVLKKDITGSNTVTGVWGGYLNECKSKYLTVEMIFWRLFDTKRVIGGKYLVLWSSHPLKMRELSFSQFWGKWFIFQIFEWYDLESCFIWHNCGFCHSKIEN